MNTSFTISGDVMQRAAPNSVVPLISFSVLINLRWVALLGQSITLLVVDLYFGMVYPRLIAWSIVGLSTLVNLLLTISYRRSIEIPIQHSYLYLIYDLGQLGVLLFVTGGLNNPFVIMMLAPVVISASFLPIQQAVLVTSAGIFMSALLYLSPFRLPWYNMGLQLPEYLRMAVLLALCISMIFIAVYLGRLSADRHKMMLALQATELALMREQKLTSLGGLAAAAAHELGSPLTTIMLVIKELQDQLKGEYRDDVDLLAREVSRCRDILRDLSLNFANEHAAPYQDLPVRAALEVVVERCDNPKKKDLEIIGQSSRVLRLSSEFSHALVNIINNALQFAHSKVQIRVGDQSIIISDDGPGFPEDVLSRIGQPYVSGRVDLDDEIHLGLGLFITQRLLEKAGFLVYFRNDGGALCEVRLPDNKETIHAPK